MKYRYFESGIISPRMDGCKLYRKVAAVWIAITTDGFCQLYM